MTKRPTPLERAAAGEPSDRRKRYEQKMRSKGFKRVTIRAKPETLELIKEMAAFARTLSHEDAKRFWKEALEATRGVTERPQRSEDAPRPRAAPKGRS